MKQGFEFKKDRSGFEKVSIVIVVYNQQEKLRSCLKSLAKQSYPRESMEIIVVDDGSIDGTVAGLSRSFPEIKIVQKIHSGADNSRNAGVAAARGDYVLFIDADCTAAPHWIESMLSALQDDLSPVVGGRIRHNDNFVVKVIGVSDFGGFQGLETKDLNTIPCCNMGVAKYVFDTIHFDPHAGIGGDVLFCAQLRSAGYRLTYSPAPVVFHHPPADLHGFFKRAVRYGEGFVRIRRANPEIRYSLYLKGGVFSVVPATLGRTLLDWYRLLKYRKESDVRIVEVFPAMGLLFIKRVVSVYGAVRECMKKAP